MGLQEEIDRKRAEIKSDSYPMSIGELVNLYKDKEIDIHPEFQRLFRWKHLQKVKLIESILLDIPIPPIFVAQDPDGTWDVVDGVQRLSTIFEFMGVLTNEEMQEVNPLILSETKYLPSLGGKKWEDLDNPENSLTPSQKLSIKRSKLNINIILKDSDKNSKYELFQRLNTGGSPLSEQELRNCIFIMENREMYSWILDLSKNSDFQECIKLSEKQQDEKYDMELVVRFLVFRTMNLEEITGRIWDMSEFLTEKMLEIYSSLSFDSVRETKAFNDTFKILNETMKGRSFRRYDSGKDKFSGAFSLSAFEVIALGIGYHHEELYNGELDVEATIKRLWTSENFTTGAGVNVSVRLRYTVSLGRKLFET